MVCNYMVATGSLLLIDFEYGVKFMMMPIEKNHNANEKKYCMRVHISMNSASPVAVCDSILTMNTSFYTLQAKF